jgi:hypothetical protein
LGLPEIRKAEEIVTNEQIFEIADKYGWVDDFNRWNFPGDVALLEFVDALAEAEQPDLARVGEVGVWDKEKNT